MPGMTEDSVAIEPSDDAKSYKFLGSSRFALCFVFMFGFAMLYAMRVDMSVAIICMVNHTAIKEAELAEKAGTNESVPVVEPIPASCVRGGAGQNSSSASEDGPFVWDSFIQNQILGAFFWGYPISQIPGGWIASSVGGRWVIFSCIFFLSLATVLLPFVSGSWIAVAVFRGLQGLASGAMFPAAHSIVSQWAPPLERSMITTIAYSGTQLGNVFTFPISGFFCQYIGWEMVFYAWGSIGFAWLIMWFFFGYNRPAEHPRITESEKHYITRAIGNQTGHETIGLCSIPWLSIIRSPAVIAIFCANFTSDWGAYTFLSQTPRYMKSVHHFDIGANASLSALPYIGYWLFISISGPLADLMRERKWLSTVATRRLFSITGFLLPSALLIVLGYVSCEYWILALVLLILIISLSGLQYASWVVSHVDIAPKYAGILYGICNSLSCAAGIMTNTVAGLFMSANPTLEEWRLLFFITAGIMAVGSVIYCIFIRADVQPWALDRGANDEDKEKVEAVALTAVDKENEAHT